MVKEVLKSYRKHVLDKTQALMMLLLIALICGALGYFAPISLVFTSILLFLPSLYAFQGINDISNAGGRFSFKLFFLCFASYYRLHLGSGYRSIISLLKALLTFMAISVAGTIIAYYVLLYIDPTFNQIINNLNMTIDASELLKAMNSLLEHHGFNLALLIIEILAYYFSSLMYIHAISINSSAIFAASLVVNAGHEKEAAMLYHLAFKLYRKDYYKDYYKYCWLGLLLFTCGTTLGAYLGTLFIYNISQIAIFSVFVGCFFLLFYLPYHFDMIKQLFIKYADKYQEATLLIAQRDLKKLKEQKFFEEDMLKDIDARIAEIDQRLQAKHHENNNDKTPINNDKPSSSSNNEKSNDSIDDK